MKVLIFLITILMFFSCENITKPNEGDMIMENLNDGLKITGKYRTIIHRGATGEVEISEWQENTINSNLKEKVQDSFLVSQDYALNNLFIANATPPAAGLDGIAAMVGAGPTFYSMITSITQPTSTSIKATGTLTGFAITVDDASIGWNFATGFTVLYAEPTSWVNKVLTTVDTLTVEWTITVGA
uniref:Uncharacterized protein n=1 Tax=viral metagenome TaxID=1070528 RepID=A0A6H1ZVR4_9ZZZZ